ncbi:Fanconi anemia group B protein [Tachysurus vachellii]|uniref:Fanconi anemia group B protein n=1 Tax=Tachysurus vachellii TaxID=175792 RepID=UPI00296AACE4|nr:Fanconi anemia group B protein [Tachysurus vachellii]
MASVHQRLHMVTLHGDLLIFQCKYPSSRGSEIIFWRMSFARDSASFVNVDDKITPMYENTSRAVRIVHCTAAINVKTRQRSLCVLLRLHRKASQGFKYMLYSLNNRTSAKLHVEFSLPYEMGKDVSILHGPTLVWSHEDMVFYTSAETGSVKEVPIRLKVNFLGELPLPQRPLAVLGLQKMTEEGVGNDGEDKTVLYFLHDGRTFSADCLLPSAYSLVVRCMLVVSAKEVAGSLRSTVVAATCRRQLVWFENGFPEEVCLLPYEEPRSVRTVHTGSGCLLVVVFEHGNVCAVWKDTFKVAACWTDVRLLLVDDFLHAGFEQMLLLFEDIDSADRILGNFLLTDLCGISYSCGKAESEDVNRCEAAEENITLTIQALEARLQSGLAFLQNLQSDLHVKDHVILQCVSALHDLLSDQKHVASPALQEGLVSLLDEQSEEDECAPYVRMKTNPDESLLKVERVWHRVIGQRLVFGALLSLTNQMTESENMIAAIIATPPMVRSVNKVICYPEPLTSVAPGPPNAKRSRFPCGPAVIIITDLAPLFTSDPVNCSVLLCFSTREAGRTSQHCELVHLDLKGALEGKFQPRLFEDCSIDSDESREDLLSLMVAFEAWHFHLISTDHTLVDILCFLEEKFRAKRIKSSLQYLLCSTQLSSTMLFHWKPCSSFDGMLDVYCSDQLGLLHFLDILCNFLPVSHCIKLKKSGKDRIRSPALSMEHEIRTTKEGVVALIHGGVEDPSSDLFVHISREQWLKEQSVQLPQFVEIKRYHQLVERAINLKMASDVAMLLGAELNEY